VVASFTCNALSGSFYVTVHWKKVNGKSWVENETENKKKKLNL